MVETKPRTLIAHGDALFDALVDEGRALQSLQGVLETQRQAVAENDRTAIEESVHAIGRVLLILDEARRRRQTLVEHLSGRGDVPLSQLEDAFGEPLPDQVREAFLAVRTIGQNLRREVTINKHIIDRTLQIGDRFLQRLFTERDASSHYDEESRNGNPVGGVMVDRQA